MGIVTFDAIADYVVAYAAEIGAEDAASNLLYVESDEDREALAPDLSGQWADGRTVSELLASALSAFPDARVSEDERDILSTEVGDAYETGFYAALAEDATE